jgi:protein ImuB
MLFACIFVPDFPAAAIVRNEPELRGQAIAVLDGTPPLLRVIAANERARLDGIEIGMTKLQAAARLAASAKARQDRAGVIRRRSPEQEAAAHAALADCARAFSPRVEEMPHEPAMVLLDPGLDRLFGSAQTIAVEIARRASALGLEVNVATASNLDAAICAARGFPGVTVIPESREAERLSPLSLDVLLENAVVESVRAQELPETFDRWGVRTFRAFAALPEIAVSERLGPDGVYLQKLARAEGTRTLVPTDAPLDFEEAIELEYPIEDMEALAFVLNRLIEQLCERLAARALSTSELRLRMKLEGLEHPPQRHGDTEETRKANHGFTRKSADQKESDKYSLTKGVLRSADQQIIKSADLPINSPDYPITQLPNFYEHAIRFPVPMLDTKTFLRLWQLELRANPPAAAVEKIWLSAEAVQPRFSQGGLFLPASPEPERLELTLARIAGVVRVPSQAGAEPKGARVGSAEVLDTHAPDAFRVKRFDPPRPEDGPGAKQSAVGKSTTVLRRFRPPVRITIETKDGHPVRLHALESLPHFLGSGAEISWRAGPWHTSGEWWNQPWSREEWDVAMQAPNGQVFCRLYRDAIRGEWFMEGAYD